MQCDGEVVGQHIFTTLTGKPEQARLDVDLLKLVEFAILSGDTAFRRAYLRSVVDRVEVDDAEIRIHGRKTVLERLVMGAGRLRQECPVLFANGAPVRIKVRTPI